MMRPVLGVTASSGGLITTLLAGGWTAAVLLTVLVLVLVGAVCWVIADPDRPGRLALLITSWRSRTPARINRPTTPAKPKTPRAVTGRK